MAISYRHKRKSTSGYTWQSTDLLDGEVGVNTVDGTMHTKAGTVVKSSVISEDNVNDAGQVVNIRVMTQAAYDALVTKDSKTLYIING